MCAKSTYFIIGLKKNITNILEMVKGKPDIISLSVK